MMRQDVWRKDCSDQALPWWCHSIEAWSFGHGLQLSHQKQIEESNEGWVEKTQPFGKSDPWLKFIIFMIFPLCFVEEMQPDGKSGSFSSFLFLFHNQGIRGLPQTTRFPLHRAKRESLRGSCTLLSYVSLFAFVLC